MDSDYILAIVRAMAVAAALGVGLTFIIWWLYRSLYAGLGLVLALFVAETGAAALPIFSIGVSLYPQDLVFVLIGIASAVRALSLTSYSTILRAWLFFGAVLMGSFVLGVIQFGSTAGVEFRQYYYFWICALYFATFSITERQLTHVAYGWCVAAAGVLLIVLYRWSADFIGWDNSSWSGLAGTTTLRVVHAAQALVIAQALSILLYLRLRTTATAWTAMMPWFAIAVIVLQHRTVWIAMIACLLAIFYLEQKSRGRLMGNLTNLVLLAAALAIPVLVAGNYLDTVTDSLQASVAEAQGERSTLMWRVQSWQELLKAWSTSGPLHYLFGNPFGAGFNRYLDMSGGGMVHHAPHSYFVQTLLRVGLVGSIALILVYVRAFTVLYRHEAAPGKFPQRGLLLFLVAQLVYFITYSPAYEQGILLGTVLALVGSTASAAKRGSVSPSPGTATRGAL